VNQRHGIVLVIVLIVVAMLSLGAYAFTEIMLSHHEGALMSVKQAQSRALVDSGVASAQMFLAQDEQTRLDSGGDYNNPGAFQNLIVVESEEPEEVGCVTVLSAKVESDGNLDGVRYGLEDESTRLNLNALIVADEVMEGGGRTLLMGLPGMTEDIADAILDWIDPDEEPREFGVEFDYYAGLSPPYAPKNGGLETVEELLLVRGVTPSLLFGGDVNRNGMIDGHETVGSSEPGMERGWSAYLTLFSKESNKTSAGEPRINVNGDDLQQLHEDISAALSAEWADFIILYRQYGPYTEQSSEGGADSNAATGAATIDFNVEASTTIGQLYELIGARVAIPVEEEESMEGGDGEGGEGGEGGDEEEEEPIIVPSPIPEGDYSQLPEMVDVLTAWSGDFMPGRININQAPRPVLLGIPGISEIVVDSIISARSPDPAAEDAGRQDETWLLVEGLVTLGEMRTLAPFVTGGGDVKRGQFVGYFQGGGIASRAEVIFDATETIPRILSYRDISHLGRGYALDILGAAPIAQQP
jgi:hypothetical protein